MIPAGMMICQTLAAILSGSAHAGCYITPVPLRVECINYAPNYAQVVVRSTDGTETRNVYITRHDAEEIDQ